jgi:hypothetical protein
VARRLELDHFANGIIAKRIIELAKAGERNPDLLCEGALKQLREHLYGDRGCLAIHNQIQPGN